MGLDPFVWFVVGTFCVFAIVLGATALLTRSS